MAPVPRDCRDHACAVDSTHAVVRRVSDVEVACAVERERLRLVELRAGGRTTVTRVSR